ncbi:hypothetical protein M885DRAFT_324448 [Pelagophyceae sp. CCMP2097]|nr:hypothetical protein M885DRAFT_324448 [Pelagophyceae sp. CCMP2097]
MAEGRWALAFEAAPLVLLVADACVTSWSKSWPLLVLLGAALVVQHDNDARHTRRGLVAGAVLLPAALAAASSGLAVPCALCGAAGLFAWAAGGRARCAAALALVALVGGLRAHVAADWRSLTSLALAVPTRHFVAAALGDDSKRAGEALILTQCAAVFVADGIVRVRDRNVFDAAPERFVAQYGLIAVFAMLRVGGGGTARGAGTFLATQAAVFAAVFVPCAVAVGVGFSDVFGALNPLQSRATAGISAWWAILLAAAAAACRPRRAKDGEAPRASEDAPHAEVRKYFHVLAVAMFAPTAALDAAFVGACYGVAAGLLLWVELARAAVPRHTAGVTQFYAQ